MLLPILGIAFVGIALLASRKQTTYEFVQERVAGAVRIPAPSPRVSVFNSMLNALAREGKPVPRWLVVAAIKEAHQAGEYGIVRAIAKAFPPIAQASEPSPSEPSIDVGKQPELVVGKNSPIYGVSNDEWTDFVGKLKTQEPSYRSERHIGAYHHNTNRLNELGIDPGSLADEASQYGALEADFKDTLSRHAKLINEFAGDVIYINGQQTPITRSGILGLIKCAGVDGATGWLRNEGDRARYPMTTEMFLRTNGMF